MTEPSMEDWVTVRTCGWGYQADLLLGTGGVRVQVRASGVDRATELLDALEGAVGQSPPRG